MIQKKKAKQISDSAHVSTVNNYSKTPKFKPDLAKKSQGVKRKFDHADQHSSQPSSEGGKKFKKRKLKGKQNVNKMDSPDSKEELKTEEATKSDGATAKPPEKSPGIPQAQPKNKMNIKVDKNWEALLKV